MSTIHRSRVTLFRSRESGQLSTALELQLVAVCSSVQPHNPQAEGLQRQAKSNPAISMSAPCYRIRALAGRVHRVWSFDVNVHLLSHVKRSVLLLHPINDFENARVHAF